MKGLYRCINMSLLSKQSSSLKNNVQPLRPSEVRFDQQHGLETRSKLFQNHTLQAPLTFCVYLYLMAIKLKEQGLRGNI